MQFRSFDEFWVFYMSQHSKASTRRWHCCGTGMALAMVVAAVVGRWWWMPLAGVGVGYGFAWYSHFFVEGNRPASFGHPVWSFVCDLKMLALTVRGRMKMELKRLE